LDRTPEKFFTKDVDPRGHPDQENYTLNEWVGTNALGLGVEISAAIGEECKFDHPKLKEQLLFRLMFAIRRWHEHSFIPKLDFETKEKHDYGTKPDAILEVMCRRYEIGEVEDGKFLDDNIELYWGEESKGKTSLSDLKIHDYTGFNHKCQSKRSNYLTGDSTKLEDLIQFDEKVYSFQIQRVVGEGIHTEDSMGSDAMSGFEFEVENIGTGEVMEQFAEQLIKDAKKCFGERKEKLDKRILTKKRGKIEAVKFLVLTGYWSHHSSTQEGEDYDAGVDYFGRISLNQIGKLFEMPKAKGAGCLE